MSDLTDLEQAVMNRLVEAWNAYTRLPAQHGDDNDEFRHGIHRLQEKILARPTRKRMNERWWL